MLEGMTNEVPKLCHLKKWPDFDGYGFNLYGDKGKEGQNIGVVDAKSPAELGGLKVGDMIIEVNGVNVLSENHKTVVEKIKSCPNEVKLLLVSPSCWDYYVSKSVLITSDLDFIQQFETPPNNPHVASYYSKGSKKSHSSVSQEQPLRRCRLHRWAGMQGYGFNLQTLENEHGKYVGQIDLNSSAHLGGLKEGDRILKVNGVEVTNMGHNEVVDIIRSDPGSVTLLVVDLETEEYYKRKGEVLNIEELKEEDNVAEFSNPESNPYVQAGNSNSEMQAIAQDNLNNNLTTTKATMETRFDDDDDDDENNNNNNNNNFNQNNDESNNNNNNNNNITNDNATFQKPSSTSSSSPTIDPLSFSSSAKEARMKMPKKTRVVDSNLTLQDKYQILQRL